LEINDTESIWNGIRVKNLPIEIQNVGRRKLRMLNNSQSFFRFERFASKLVIIFILLVVFCIGFYEVKKFKACMKWEKAYSYSTKNRLSESTLLYESIYPILKTDPFFLFNYGSELIKSNECGKSINFLNKVYNYRTFYDLYLNIGQAYECCNNDSLAKQSYKKAAFLIPHMFTPKYYLFKLYCRSNKKEYAVKMAKEISEMKIKVFSPTIGLIKNETIKYLEKEKPEFLK
jgi:hypothetical protein